MYDILKSISPKMPELKNGTESIYILLIQTSKDMHEPIVPVLFSVFWGAYLYS